MAQKPTAYDQVMQYMQTAQGKQLGKDLQNGHVLAHNASAYAAAWKENASQLPSLGGQLDAMRRDALTDIRDTFMQTFFGQKEGPGAAGMPLNPTQFMVNNELGTASFQDMLDHGAQGTVHGKQQERGLER